MKNYTAITTFILVGLTDDPNLQILLFIFLFLIYLLSVVGNLTIITLTLVDSHLKSPMYFFLWNFSILEVSFTTVCIPRFLYTMASGDNNVTYSACATQLFFVTVLGVTEFFLLTTMSYDHYVAICKPLHYITFMNNRVCIKFLIGTCIIALIIVIPPFGMGLSSSFVTPMSYITLAVMLLPSWRLPAQTQSL